MPRVLVIDDEPDLVRVLEYNLREASFEVDTATSGETGLVIAKGRKPDLVVLDLMLPDLSGFEVCRHLRSDPELKSVPILVLTAKSSEEDRIAGLELGADDYVTKPFSQRELVLRVGSAPSPKARSREPVAAPGRLVEAGRRGPPPLHRRWRGRADVPRV